MNEIGQALEQINTCLDQFHAEFAVIGGLAVGIRGLPRTTQDIDLAVMISSDQEAEKIIHYLLQCGYRTQSVLQRSQTGNLSTVRLIAPQMQSDLLVDLLFSSSGIEKEVVQTAEKMELLGIELPVARLEHLLAMKLLSWDVQLRPTDIQDIYALIDRANESQLKEAARLARLITNRGYHRQRDLVGDLENFIRLAKQRRESEEFFSPFSND